MAGRYSRGVSQPFSYEEDVNWVTPQKSFYLICTKQIICGCSMPNGYIHREQFIWWARQPAICERGRRLRGDRSILRHWSPELSWRLMFLRIIDQVAELIAHSIDRAC